MSLMRCIFTYMRCIFTYMRCIFTYMRCIFTYMRCMFTYPNNSRAYVIHIFIGDTWSIHIYIVGPTWYIFTYMRYTYSHIPTTWPIYHICSRAISFSHLFFSHQPPYNPPLLLPSPLSPCPLPPSSLTCFLSHLERDGVSHEIGLRVQGNVDSCKHVKCGYTWNTCDTCAYTYICISSV